MIVLLDIDDTLCDTVGNDYKNSVPNMDAIAKINRLFQDGHTIRVFTGRGSHSGIDWYGFTYTQLKSWGLQFHELIVGKPEADIIIDDKAMNSADWLGKGPKGIHEVKKVWGKEVWLQNNDKYCGKLLYLDDGAVASYHLHKEKTETFFCIEGCALLTVEDREYILRPNSNPVTISPNQRHNFFGITDAVIVEISTPHSDKDVVRFSESSGGYSRG